MTDTDLREAVHRLRDSIPVLPVNHVEFQRRVQRARRRRTLRRVGVVAAAAVAVVGIAGLSVPGSRSGSKDQPAPLTQVAVDVGPAYPLPFILPGNRLMLAMPDGTTIATGLRAQEVLGQTSTEIVYHDNDSHLVARTVDGTGQVGRERRLTPSPVRSAVASPDGSTVAFIDLDDTLRIRGVDQAATAPDLVTSTTERDQVLVDTDGNTWLLFDYTTRTMTLHRSASETDTQVTLDLYPAGTFGDLAGDTAAVETSDGAVVTFATTGARERVLEGDAGGSGFALSPDGTRYAAGDNAEGGVILSDIGGGDRRRVVGIADDVSVRQVFWQTDTRFYVTTTDRSGTALWSCTVYAECASLAELTRGLNQSAVIPFG